MGDQETNQLRTLMEAIRYFSDPKVCVRFVSELRWPDGVQCPHCASKTEYFYLSTRRIRKCKAYRKKFSPSVGTIFEDSAIGLDKWLAAFWMAVNARNEVSSYEIHRSLCVTQKTVWFMMHRIRLALQSGSIVKVAGKVEVDETFIGGKARNMRKAIRERKITGTSGKDKTLVVGVLERKGQVCTTVVKSTLKVTNRTSKAFMKPLICTFTIALAFSCVSCKSGPSSPSAKPESSYRLPDQIILTASAIRDADDGTVVEGATNLPSNTKLGVELIAGERATAQDFSVYVDSGKFRSAAFRKGTSPLPPGKQKVHIFTYFNTNWQSESVLKLLGKGGGNLKPSAIIHSEDAQLFDGDNILDYTVELIVPPLASAPTKSTVVSQPESTLNDKAIEMVKKAVLVVDGSRSSETVEDGVRFYFKSPGIRKGNGWSATPTGKDKYNVVLDFINTVAGKEQHDTAMWEVNVVTKTVLYRNKNAKNFSWIPNY